MAIAKVLFYSCVKLVSLPLTETNFFSSYNIAMHFTINLEYLERNDSSMPKNVIFCFQGSALSSAVSVAKAFPRSILFKSMSGCTLGNGHTRAPSAVKL